MKLRLTVAAVLLSVVAAGTVHAAKRVDAPAFRSMTQPEAAKALLLNPKDKKGLAEVGAYYLANGDRATAEALFARSFQLESDIWATVSAAGAYLDVPPQE